MRKFIFPNIQGVNFASNEIRTSKYTFLTFFPRNFYEQFRKIANSYFLLLIILQIFPEYKVIPVEIAALPLIIIFLITAAKDAVEDWVRHSQDKAINNRLTQFLDIPNKAGHVQEQTPLLSVYVDNSPVWTEIAWRNVKVGQLLKLESGDPIPADLVIVSSSNPDCSCFVETMNLDGETNLKLRQGLAATQDMKEPNDFMDLHCGVTSEDPNSNLNAYQVIVEFPSRDKKFCVDLNGILLRGTVLKNTDWVVGLVIATGKDTKQVRNTGETPSKQSELDKMMNFHIALNLLLMVIVCIICCIGYAVWSEKFRNAIFSGGLIHESLLWDGFVNFWAGLILYQNIVPISLYICMEFVKSFQSWFIRQDLDMYYEDTDFPCEARTWNLTDNLGQIEYIFSDKTGTLTRNIMEFKKCSIHGELYEGDGRDQDATLESFIRTQSSIKVESEWLQNGHTARKSSVIDYHDHKETVDRGWFDPELDEYFADSDKMASEQGTRIDLFFSILATCHSVVVDGSQDKKLSFRAQSPDEQCLVSVAAENGYIFTGRSQSSSSDCKTVKISVHGTEREYEVLNVLEFTSTRKRMSIVVRDAAGNILLFCKGADSVIFERCASGQDDLVDKTSEQLLKFSEDGLRTLCLAYKKLSENEYLEWEGKHNQINTLFFETVEAREDALENLSDELEQNLVLVGSTAIEDQLQEGVEGAITDLLRAGIKLWVLTGDKMETAINIGYLSGLLKPTHGKPVTLITLKGIDDPDALRERLHLALKKEITQDVLQKTSYALVVDGQTLKVVFETTDIQDLFLEIACRCKTVVCCRVSPLQKAQVVELVKQKKKAVTLAIGDGANDVSMIQSADVGVGISGKEGMQAALSSDYAIAQFRYLKKLLLVHGRWCYSRNSLMILNFYLKSLVFSLVIFWFQFYSGFSAAVIYEFTYMIFYNQVFTVAPVMILAVFDRDMDPETCMDYPELYGVDSVKHKLYTHTRFFFYTIESFWSSLVCFLVPIMAYKQDIVDHMGHTAGQYFIGTVMACSAILTVNLNVALDTNSWTIIHAVLYIGSCLVFFLYSFVLSFNSATTIYGLWREMFNTLDFWLIVVICVVLSMAPRFIYFSAKRLIAPDERNIYQEIQYLKKKVDKEFKKWRYNI